MFVKCLNEQQKDDVVDRFVNHEESQSDIADAYDVSRRTIQRVLQERGILKNSTELVTCTVHDKALLNVIAKHNITEASTLDDALGRTAFTLNNIVTFIGGMTDENYEKMQSLLTRVREIRKERQEGSNAAA